MLKQSDVTPALKILDGCETRIQSSKDWDLGVIRVGSLISCVTFRLLSMFSSLSDDPSNQFLLKSSHSTVSHLQGMELMVETMQSKDSAGEEGGLYMLPMAIHLFV